MKRFKGVGDFKGADESPEAKGSSTFGECNAGSAPVCSGARGSLTLKAEIPAGRHATAVQAAKLNRAVRLAGPRAPAALGAGPSGGVGAHAGGARPGVGVTPGRTPRPSPERQKAEEKAQRGGNAVGEAAACNRLGESPASRGESPRPPRSPPPLLTPPAAARTLRGGFGGAAAGAAAAGGRRPRLGLRPGSPHDPRAPGRAGALRGGAGGGARGLGGHRNAAGGRSARFSPPPQPRRRQLEPARSLRADTGRGAGAALGRAGTFIAASRSPQEGAAAGALRQAQGAVRTLRPPRRKKRKDIQKGGSVRMALQEPQHITVTPMKAFRRSPAARPANSSSKGAPQGPPHAKAAEAPALNGNIPGLFTRVMGRGETPPHPISFFGGSQGAAGGRVRVSGSIPEAPPTPPSLHPAPEFVAGQGEHHQLPPAPGEVPEPRAVTEKQRKRLLSWKWRVQRLLRTFPQKVPPYGPGSQRPQG
ncbi:uncharacterized protein LOC141955037 [Athene noctua]|uniref:uncharacterized protein LOC141955037 n=1 Tax=Athene noctua TaxID=126797 RepID=UPI003EBC0E17